MYWHCSQIFRPSYGHDRPVVPRHPQILEDQLTPISTRGGQIMTIKLHGAPPDFQIFLRPCNCGGAMAQQRQKTDTLPPRICECLFCRMRMVVELSGKITCNNPQCLSITNSNLALPSKYSGVFLV